MYKTVFKINFFWNSKYRLEEITAGETDTDEQKPAANWFKCFDKSNLSKCVLSGEQHASPRNKPQVRFGKLTQN